MTKFIVRASSTTDNVALMVDTKNALRRGIDWASDRIENVGDVSVEEWEVQSAIMDGDFAKVDEMVFGPEVPTGGMVVVCNGDEPRYGFVCGNESEWFSVDLPRKIKEAIVPPKTWGVDLGDSRRWFNSRRELKSWVMEGLYCTDGAERDHYVDMLCQLEDGAKVLKYDND